MLVNSILLAWDGQICQQLIIFFSSAHAYAAIVRTIKKYFFILVIVI